LKAFYLAVAFVVSIGPASANGLSLSGHSVHVAQSDVSRHYQAEWFSAHTRSYQTEVPLLTAKTLDDAQVDPRVDAASAQISAALKAKIRAIVAFARQQVRNTTDGSRVLRSRIRVRCAAKQVVAKRAPSLSRTPALMLSERAAEPQLIADTIEMCTVKLLQLRRNTPSEPRKRPFEVTLPSPSEISP
jgi:hypothetical protein